VRFIQFLQFMMACAVALAGLGAQARVAENVALEKFELMNIECARVWMAQAVDATGENAFTYGVTYQYFDKESGLNYNYFRSYDSRTGRYSQSDPIGLDGGWNRFTYVDGDGINGSDPFGLAACYVSFPYMPIEYSPGKTTTLLGGHAGVVGYDSSGSTRYYEYGRYSPNSSGVFGEKLPADDGNFRRTGVPDVQFGADGKPTPASMDALKKALSRAGGKGTDASLTCDDTADEKKVYEYLEQLAKDKARAKYSWNPLSPNQCRSVAKGAIGAGRK
jgi:RHS repeat-associated protein